MSVIQLLASNGFITVNKHLARTLGLDEAVIFGELCSKYDYRETRGELDENGFFYCTVEDLEENTALGEHRQRKAINNLVKIGLVEQVTKGLPRKRFFRINENVVLKIFNIQSLENLGTSPAVFEELVSENSETSSGNSEELVPQKMGINNNTINKNTVNNKYNKKENREKKKFGEFGNVLLTDEEHNKLIDRYGSQTLDRFIKNLDLWLGEGHTKKSHYMTIIRWVENEKEKGVKSYAGNTGTYRARNETGYHGFTPSTGVKTEPDF